MLTLFPPQQEFRQLVAATAEPSEQMRRSVVWLLMQRSVEDEELARTIVNVMIAAGEVYHDPAF